MTNNSPSLFKQKTLWQNPERAVLFNLSKTSTQNMDFAKIRQNPPPA